MRMDRGMRNQNKLRDRQRGAIRRKLPSPHAALIPLLMLFCSTGASCAHSFRNPFARLGPPAPEVITPASTLDEIMFAVNQNVGRIQNYQTNNASISVPGTLGLPMMSGRLAAERPKRLRLRASAGVVGPLVDLGSNDELFWFWVRQNQPPGVYFARHDQFLSGAAHRTLPIEPEWLLDAIGFAEFHPDDLHQGPVPLGDGKLEISSVMQRPGGSVTRRMVVDAKRAWVLEQHFYDDGQNPLASAVARSHKYYEDIGVSLPQQIDIQMPAAELALSIDVGDVVMNTVAPNPQLWQMPVIEGAPPIDVGSGSISPQTPTIGSQMLRTAWNDPSLTVGAPPEIDLPTPPVVSTIPIAASLNNSVPTVNVAGAAQQPRQQSLPPRRPTVDAASALRQQLPPGGVAARQTIDGHISPR